MSVFSMMLALSVSSFFWSYAQARGAALKPCVGWAATSGAVGRDRRRTSRCFRREKRSRELGPCFPGIVQSLWEERSSIIPVPRPHVDENDIPQVSLLSIDIAANIEDSPTAPPNSSLHPYALNNASTMSHGEDRHPYGAQMSHRIPHETQTPIYAQIPGDANSFARPPF
ncbi:uncharacterized protein MYCGRDRAFT_111761 [Zymoseptoria tritici IPO323]|uniref:Secreted protein n=1 Tax=Zymoseptoria tritici (strain CBS 115943 / IPO323) TaxID=336722 RepID=F9XRB5_ZYMTI|nr:uncharacterized protein MYCGRDRAFT_111761 [Zymoseptoria tritici IPO323]EGP82237.1 hypothetical protein MYCGRDRAFT_111761 [Zymoseptoria tritici IPO323]